MKSHSVVDATSEPKLASGHRRLRLTVAAVLLFAFVISPVGGRLIDVFMRHDLSNWCGGLEAQMYQVIDDYKYDDDDRFDRERRRIEGRYAELSCTFSTYPMYTAENQL